MFTHWKISTKILFGYVMALIFLLIVGIISLVQLNQINLIITELTTKTAKEYQTANELISGIYSVRLYANRYIRTASEQDYNEYQTRLNKLENTIAKAEKSFIQKEQAKRVADIKQDFLMYKTDFEEVTRLTRERSEIVKNTLGVNGAKIDIRIKSLQESFRTANDEAALAKLITFSNNIQHARLQIFKFLQEGDPSMFKIFESDYQAANDSLLSMRGQISDSTSVQTIDEMLAFLKAYHEGSQSIQKNYAQYTNVLAELDSYSQSIRQAGDDLVAASQKTFDLKQEEVNSRVNSTFMVILIVLLISIVGSFGGGLWIARMITKPISGIVEAAQSISSGDLEQEITYEAQDEIGFLANAFRQMIAYLREMARAAGLIAQGDLTVKVEPKSSKDLLGNAFASMVENLRNLVHQLNDSVLQLNSASEQLTQAAEQTSEATSQISVTIQQVTEGIGNQAADINKTAEASDQMARAIDGVAKGAQEQAEAVAEASRLMSKLSEASQEVRQGAVKQAEQMVQADTAREMMSHAIQNVVTASEEVAQESQQAASTAVEGMQMASLIAAGVGRVRDVAEALAQSINELGKRSGQIGAIVETIDDIAAQTNLLALNAAIEAARAGEHGKGFAVVADEVRKLAERSSMATKEISDMVHTIQAGAKQSVETMSVASQDVEEAVRLTEQAKASFQGIVQSTESSVSRVQAIRDAIAAMNQAEQQLEKVVRLASELAENNRIAADIMGNLNEEMMVSLNTVSAVVEENTAATEEMSASANEVAQAIENVASISEENSAAMEEVSASTEEMSAQAEELTASAQSLSEMAVSLRKLIEQFKL